MVRSDFPLIANWIRPNTRVLDLGCGDGGLLAYLIQERAVHGYGVDIEDANILSCVARNLNVIQTDLESGLSDFESHSFDYVILSQTLQAVKNTEHILMEMLRVGQEGIISFPNFGYWQHRRAILEGQMPVSEDLPYAWYDTPNVHLCTLHDFESFCAARGIVILDRLAMCAGQIVTDNPNLYSSLAFYRFHLPATR